MTATLTPDLDRCERGLHLAAEIDETTGQPTCEHCGSLVTVPLTPLCKCGRGLRVTVLIGFDACCATCATEAIPERTGELARAFTVGRFAGRHRRGGGGQGGV